MADYKFLGVNIWTYSDQRAIVWLGGKKSHYSDKKHHLKVEIGEWGNLGIESTIGGEDRGVMLRIGLGIITLYLELTGVVSNKYKKAEEIAKQEKCYAYELDYSNEGRETGVMVHFRRGLWIRSSFWNDIDKWTSRSIKQKLKRFPYCEGLGKTFYLWDKA